MSLRPDCGILEAAQCPANEIHLLNRRPKFFPPVCFPAKPIHGPTPDIARDTRFAAPGIAFARFASSALQEATKARTPAHEFCNTNGKEIPRLQEQPGGA